LTVLQALLDHRHFLPTVAALQGACLAALVLFIAFTRRTPE
jgi:hypothetical protein